MTFGHGNDFHYCDGCGTYWTPDGCGDNDHTCCPSLCGICGKPITGRDDGFDCAGHSFAEARAHITARRGRSS